MRTNYAGIDYSGRGSTVNRDMETGIRYGMISQHSLSDWSMSDVYEAPDVGFEETKKQLVADIKAAILTAVDKYGRMDDEIASEIAQDIVDNSVDDNIEWHECGESGPYRYEKEGLVVQTTSDNELWVFKSPYYTHAQFCSPCVPGAGNLNCFCPDGPKTYCLPPDWFDNKRAPYSVWKVENDECVYHLPETTVDDE